MTVNCQPNCTESLTTGCTEVRSAPQDIPMRDWDYRDRYEGARTHKGEIQDDGSNAGYHIYWNWKIKKPKWKTVLVERYLSFNSWKKCL